ncbi:hypothetical protein [Sphaerochaeta sp. PS]|uniref:hypothetical protein n=1 Tax=Sphaerochaeta sp. PS TaxID=3076336 RepID=UPI0028A512BA|nr:hypothetical protein [Sphaerochaeta sp. PS]MDT4761836.1 hypothetical protein [Sphaerochaeta sp. PS]
MKYTIFGFSQKGLLKLGLGTEEALVLDWFVTFQGSGRMRSMIVDGQGWYWVNYAGVLEDIPIAGGSEKTIARRFAKLEASGVLDHLTVREGGTFSCFRLNEKIYTALVSDTQDTTEKGKTKVSDPRTELSEGYDGGCIDRYPASITNITGQGTELSYGGTKLGEGVGQNWETGSDKNGRPKDSLTRRTNLPDKTPKEPPTPIGGKCAETDKTPRPRFMKPTVEEIAAYCQERSNGIDAQEFFDSNETKGWLVGNTKTPMKDWQAAIRTWEHARKRNLNNTGRPSQGSTKARYHSEGHAAAPLSGWNKIGGTK